MAIKDTFNKAKAKVIDVASDIMSAPAQARAINAKKKADAQVADIKMVRQFKGKEPVPNDERSPLFRARANVSNMGFEREQAMKKAAKAPANQGNYETEYAKRMSGKPTRF